MKIIESDPIWNVDVYHGLTSVLAICLSYFLSGNLIFILYDVIIRQVVRAYIGKPFYNIENVEQWTLFLPAGIRTLSAIFNISGCLLRKTYIWKTFQSKQRPLYQLLDLRLIEITEVIRLIIVVPLINVYYIKFPLHLQHCLYYHSFLYKISHKLFSTRRSRLYDICFRYSKEQFFIFHFFK